ncbi:hypothetical protein O6H91_04G131200 [Diphasiastrum complanatum]|uniref:Uncharacterized protein n=3 Tax=Diphasiastrum complanatum TaxID=34168 RepID=A0ACC2E235_DIPCM|nr:hypothetical protein O6H91_04G131200 [Diphasiastrum complanatum]KAJ7560468.1 hypothetical protein O6H91_04G131200 [Diphasiastrum complanatum]KAJ7560469.1 hypothetical protein O6H91_04G131200 [Diphasiastrum complanatum]
MWRLKQFIPKDQASLEGKSVDVGAFKLQVRSMIAQGGFSSVYLAKDAVTGKQYAVKHIICNDDESLDLVRKEVAVMKSLRGHPNVVMLHAQAMYDMGRTKECFLVMDHCEKTLVHLLDGRGAGYFEEKQLLLIFLDICNAVYALHCQAPAIAHRDLKAENVLMGPDGLWKLCDFGSTSINHKCFDKPGEMGVEEDIIRKHTTPAYRSPEMWDLYRRELISEKVDIWALGCLLYRIAYLKSAFDGESKLQILNGNYKIPDMPRYSSTITELIKDMLTPNPESRPDVLQIWHRVNESLPSDFRKSFPEKPPSLSSSNVESSTHTLLDAGLSNLAKNSHPLPSRTAPPPPASKDVERRSFQSREGGSAGAFWSTQYAQEQHSAENGSDTGRMVEAKSPTVSRNVSPLHGSSASANNSPTGEVTSKDGTQTELRKQQDLENSRGRADDQGIRGHETVGHRDGFQQDEGRLKLSARTPRRSNPGIPEVSKSSKNAFDEFVSQLESATNVNHESAQKVAESSHLDLEGLRGALQQAVTEKEEVTARYEKLTAICRSQRQEIQDLKSALKAATSREAHLSSAKSPPSYSHMQLAQEKQTRSENWQAFDQGKAKQAGSIWELQDGLSDVSSGGEVSDNLNWQAFGESVMHKSATQQSENVRFKSKVSVASKDSMFGTVGVSTNALQTQHMKSGSTSKGGDSWGFVSETNSFQDSRSFLNSNASAPSSTIGRDGNSMKDNRDSRSTGQKPMGWAGF